MKYFIRIATLLAMLLMPALSVSAQSTPEPVTESGSGEASAFASGLNSPATFFDQRGNAIFEIAVTDIEDDWQDFDQYSAPQAGMKYVVVTFEFTNLTSRVDVVSPYNISMIDTMGIQAEGAYIYDNGEFMTEDVSVEPGETVEGKLAYAIFSDLAPLMIMWQPDYSAFVFIYLGDQ